MTSDFEKIERYLRDPEGEADGFWEAGPLIWVDWRDYDEWIVQGVLEKLPASLGLSYELRDCSLPRGQDILLYKNGTAAAIPYGPERMDRDTTLKAMQALIGPEYQLLWFVPSEENDTLGFALLSAPEWGRLEETFGSGAVGRQFRLLKPDSCLFEPGV